MKIKTGEQVWYINDENKVVPFTVDFINKIEALMEQDGQFVKIKISELYPTKEMAEQKLKSKDFIAICREVSRETGEVIIYELTSEIDDNLIKCLGLRGRFNPELTYFITKKETFEEYKDMFVDCHNLLVEQNLAV